MGLEQRNRAPDLTPADESLPVKRRRLTFKNRTQRVITAGALVVTLGAGGAGVAFKDHVNWLAGIVASRLSTPDNSKNITEQIDPNLQKNKRAIDAHEEMLNKFRASNFRVFGGDDKELLLFGSSDKLSYATCWPYSRAIAATETMRLIPSIGNEYEKDYQKMLFTLDKYWDTSPAGYPPGYDPGPSGQRFKTERLTDDNLWIGLILMREHDRTKDAKALDRAKAVFSLAISQWDYKNGGGIFWKVQFPGEENHDKGIVSNAPAVMLGIELYQATQDPYYLEWSQTIFEWINANLMDKSDALYFDNISFNAKDGTTKIDDRKFTYTQGVMIGAMTKLNEVDPDKYPLQNAVDLANRAIDYFDSTGYNNNAFNGIFFQNLLYLAGRSNNAEFTKRVQNSLEKIVSKMNSTNGDLTDYAGAVQLLALARVPAESYSRL